VSVPDRDRVKIGDRLEHAVESRTDVAAEIERGEAEAPAPGRLRRNLIWLGLTGVSLYLVFPSLVEVFGSWRDITKFSPGWLIAMAVLQGAVLFCLWALQRIALHLRRWRPVIASQLAGNALSKVAPGGGATGAALQYRMLVEDGVDRSRAVSGLTAANLLAFAFVTALPVLAIPALIRGGVDRNLVEAAALALGLLVVLSVLGVVLLAHDRPLAWIGRRIARVRNRLRPKSEPLTGLDRRLLLERDRILETLGPHWKRALVATAGRWAFDYGTLLAALAAVGSHPRPGLVLLAFTAAQVLAQIPVTPGGLGFVEAGLTATLALAGVSGGDAVLATFAYRLFSYWLPLPLGLVGLLLHRRRPSPVPSSG
jgi:uncharacterized protein (TIRG00374 family)